jgi:hypothetical protein
MDYTVTFIGVTAGCCIAIPTAAVMYILLGKMNDWWADKIGLGWL